MSTLDRVILASIACALWALVLGQLAGPPAARAQNAGVSNRGISLILHEIVAKAAAGEGLESTNGYDELEGRLRAILPRSAQPAPQSDVRISRQDLRSAFAACRIVGTVLGQSGQLNARLSC